MKTCANCRFSTHGTIVEYTSDGWQNTLIYGCCYDSCVASESYADFTGETYCKRPPDMDDINRRMTEYEFQKETECCGYEDRKVLDPPKTFWGKLKRWWLCGRW